MTQIHYFLFGASLNWISPKLNPYANKMQFTTKRNLEGTVYSAPYVALSSHFSWQAQLDGRFSPTL